MQKQKCKCFTKSLLLLEIVGNECHMHQNVCTVHTDLQKSEIICNQLVHMNRKHKGGATYNVRIPGFWCQHSQQMSAPHAVRSGCSKWPGLGMCCQLSFQTSGFPSHARIALVFRLLMTGDTWGQKSRQSMQAIFLHLAKQNSVSSWIEYVRRD